MLDLTVEEQQASIKVNKIIENSLILSNVIELTASVVSRVAGKDISDVINNQSLTRSVLNNIVANRIKEKLVEKPFKEGV